MTTSTTRRPWGAPRAPGPLHARIEVPGSKSETNRALLLAALADGPSLIRGAMDARDSRLFRGALQALGVRMGPLDAAELEVVPADELRAASDPVDVGLAGTVMRFIPPLAALAPRGTTTFVGDAHASERPVFPLLDGLRQLGVPVAGNAVPFSVSGGGLTGSSCTIDASGSSQFVSGLLLSAARFPHGLTLRHRSTAGASVPSRPHIDMSVAMLRERGVQVEQPDADTWIVQPGAIAALDQRIEPDLTNAAAFLAAAAIAGGEVLVPGWPRATTQGGDEIRDVLQRMGARVTLTDAGELIVRGAGLQGIDVDLHASSELTPVVAALAAVAQGTTTIRGVAHIRGHETDRLAALCQELGALGADVHETDDGLVVHGRGAGVLTGGRFATSSDHRMAHAGALVGLVVDGVQLDDITCTTKAMPDFPGLWRRLLESGAGSGPAATSSNAMSSDATSPPSPEAASPEAASPESASPEAMGRTE